MSALDPILNRAVPPEPWAEGDNIPWDDPEFSVRMLQEHLDQSHDLASRRSELIASQVALIHNQLLQRKPTRVLDLACGPGLYLNRLTELGHTGVGIDFSPASVSHARTTTTGAEFVEADLRDVDFGGGFGLVMMLYGQINVFPRDVAAAIIAKATSALDPGGWLLLEPLTEDHVRQLGSETPSWSAGESSLFSDRPHLLLTESFWDEQSRTATARFYVVDGSSFAVSGYAMSTTAYTRAELTEMLAGFERVTVDEDVPGWPHGEELLLVAARKPG